MRCVLVVVLLLSLAVNGVLLVERVRNPPPPELSELGAELSYRLDRAGRWRGTRYEGEVTDGLVTINGVQYTYGGSRWQVGEKTVTAFLGDEERKWLEAKARRVCGPLLEAAKAETRSHESKRAAAAVRQLRGEE